MNRRSFLTRLASALAVLPYVGPKLLSANCPVPHPDVSVAWELDRDQAGLLMAGEPVTMPHNTVAIVGFRNTNTGEEWMESLPIIRNGYMMSVSVTNPTSDDIEITRLQF